MELREAPRGISAGGAPTAAAAVAAAAAAQSNGSDRSSSRHSSNHADRFGRQQRFRARRLGLTQVSPAAVTDPGMEVEAGAGETRNPSDPLSFLCEMLPAAWQPAMVGGIYVIVPPAPIPVVAGRKGAAAGTVSAEGPGPYRMVVGPHWCGLLFTAALVVTFTYWLTNVQLKGLPHEPLLRGVAATGATCTLIFLFLTGCTDPGIVRPGRGLLDAEAADGEPYCDICELYQPPRTVHCTTCCCCIEELDHHCPWMSTCCGKRNMLWFKLFNFSWFCLLLFFVTISALT